MQGSGWTPGFPRVTDVWITLPQRPFIPRAAPGGFSISSRIWSTPLIIHLSKSLEGRSRSPEAGPGDRASGPGAEPSQGLKRPQARRVGPRDQRN